MEPIFLKPKALESQFYGFISNTVVWQHSLAGIIQIVQTGSNILKSSHLCFVSYRVGRCRF